jgi:hypothetical protein
MRDRLPRTDRSKYHETAPARKRHDFLRHPTAQHFTPDHGHQVRQYVRRHGAGVTLNRGGSEGGSRGGSDAGKSSLSGIWRE